VQPDTSKYGTHALKSTATVFGGGGCSQYPIISESVSDYIRFDSRIRWHAKSSSKIIKILQSLKVLWRIEVDGLA
jgi:hypothetical protein